MKRLLIIAIAVLAVGLAPPAQADVDCYTQGVGVQWSEISNTDDFSKNLIRARCEGRFGTSVLSPLGVVSCDRTA